MSPVSMVTFEKRLEKLIKEAKILDQDSDWYYLNRLWFTPAIRNQADSIIGDFVDTKIEGISNPILLIPEGLSSSFGIIPFMSAYAFKRNLHIAFWKEVGDLLSINPYIFPNPRKNKFPKDANVVVIQDVIGNGSLIYKIAKDLGKYDLDWKIHSFLGIIYLDKQNKELRDTLDKISAEQDFNITFSFLLQSPEHK